MVAKLNKKGKQKKRRIDKILYPIIIAMFAIIIIIYAQNIGTQWNIIAGDYEHNKDIVTNMSQNMAGNLNLATRMFEEDAVEQANVVLDQIQEFYHESGDQIKDKDLTTFMSPVQDLWLDITILDKQANILNEKGSVGEDSYKLSAINGARTFVNELIKNDELTSQWITISTQTDVIIKYVYETTVDEKYIIEVTANIITFNNNIDVYDIETYANDLVSNYDFVNSAYVFNTEGFSTSVYDRENPEVISNEFKQVFDDALEKKAAAIITTRKSLGYSESIWAVPVNISQGYNENVFYNYVLVLSFNNHETMNYFYAQAGINFFVALLSIVIIMMIIMRNSSQYLDPLSKLSTSIKNASEGNYDSKAKVIGARTMRNTITEYNGLLITIKDSIKKRDNAYFQTINALVNAIDASDEYTAGHCTRVMDLSVMMGKKLNLSDQDIEILKYGALLHDIGKIGIDTGIVNKNGKLTDNEYMTIKTHPTIGLDIVSNIDYLSKAKQIIDEHHEHFDGTGYPHGLKGEEIGLLSRITTIADTFDAMASERPYRAIVARKQIVKELEAFSGTQFDPELVPVFITILRDNVDDINNRVYKDIEYK